jgi:osmotically inducible lipoprotein OsmB
MKRIAMIITLAAAIGVAGCTSMTPKQQGTVTGAGIGAVAGAGIVSLAGGSAWTGAAVGMVAGGVAGHIHGSNVEEQQKKKP